MEIEGGELEAENGLSSGIGGKQAVLQQDQPGDELSMESSDHPQLAEEELSAEIKRAVIQGDIQGECSDPIPTQPGALLDINVEGLIQQLHHSKLVDLAAIGAHRKIPKGFALQAALKDEDYRRSLSIFHQHVAQHEEMAPHPGSSGGRRLQCGFDPTHVINKHALNLVPGYSHVRSTLTNNIHPIFAFERFIECPWDIYQVLMPALRLASQFLLHQAAATYFHTLAFGKRVPCRESAKTGMMVVRIQDDVPWSASNALKFEQHLESIAKHVRISFDQIPPTEEIYAIFYATRCQMSRRILPLDQQRCVRGHIDIHMDLYTTAKRLSLLKHNADPAMVLRFSFFLAVNFCHEVAHFLEMGHNGNVHEARINNNMYSEAGIAWECKMFGGRVHPISGRMDVAYGLATYNYPLAPLEDFESNVYYTIPMDYIAKLQQQSTWEADCSKTDWTVFHIPRTGARSIGACAFNMTIFDDEAEAKIVDAVIDLEEAPFKRTLDGRVLKNGRTNTGLLDNAPRLQTKAEDGSANAPQSHPRRRSKKLLLRANALQWEQVLEYTKEKLLSPTAMVSRDKRRGSF